MTETDSDAYRRPRLLAVSAIAVAIVSLAVALGALVSCRPAGPMLVVYVSVDEHVAREIVAAFEAQTGIRVLVVGDTEAKKTTGLVERLRAESGNPQADVFWSSEIFQTIALADEGVLAPYDASALTDWPAAYRDDEGRWFGFAGRARVIAYAPRRIAEDLIPETWTDLTRRSYAGRIVMADPRFGTTGGHLGAMKVHWDRTAPGVYAAFLLGLRDNNMRLLPSGNAGVVQAIVDGAADIGMTDLDDVLACRALGHDIAFVYARHSHEDEPGNGTLIIPNTVALVHGAAHVVEAKRFIEFLLSRQGEQMLAKGPSRNVPLGSGRADVAPENDVPDPLAVNYRRAAAARAGAVREAMQVLAGRAADEG